MIASFRALIDVFGIGDFAAAINVSYGAAKQMRRRNHVRPCYWPDIVIACHAKGLLYITAEYLAKLSEQSHNPDAANDHAKSDAAA